MGNERGWIWEDCGRRYYDEDMLHEILKLIKNL